MNRIALFFRHVVRRLKRTRRGELDVIKVSIPKAAFDAIPKNERDFIASLGYLANEINILNKLLLISMKSDPPSEPERQASLATTGFILRLLAGHLKEGWSLLQQSYWGGAVSRDYDALLSPNASDALTKIKKYFSGTNLINTIRSTYAFHMPVAEIARAATTYTTEDAFELYFAEAGGNCLYWGSEVLAMWDFIESAGSGDAAAGCMKYFDEVCGTSKDFVSLASGCMHVFATRYAIANDTVDQESFVLEDVPDIESLRLPYFVTGRRRVGRA